MALPIPSAARRQFIFDSAKVACGVSLLGIGLGFYAKQSVAMPALALRPPGAIDETDFNGACIRCGMCVRDCPFNILELATPESLVTTGTPYFTARKLPCEMCEDIPCVKACPTGALNHSLTEINKAKMGVAVLLDHETCLNFLGLRCDVCYRVCPVIDKAITLEMLPNTRTGRHAMFLPTVHSDACTGCGKCEKACVLEEAAIRVLPLKLAKGSLGKHYRVGWDEQKKAGGSLIDEKQMLDLPDRMPEGTILENHFDPGSAKAGTMMPGSIGPGADPISAKAGAVNIPSAPPGMANPGNAAGLAKTHTAPMVSTNSAGPIVPSSPPGMGGKP
jgi:ferredoxin-type protein NapG